MLPSSRTPEGEPNRCPICGNAVRIEPSSNFRDAPCPHCGSLLWFFSEHPDEGRSTDTTSVVQTALDALSRNDRPLPSELPAELVARAARTTQSSQPSLQLEEASLALRVLADPADIRYIRALLTALRTKYRDNRKGARFARWRARRARRHLHRAWLKRDLQAVLRNGLAILRVNPWDVYALRSLASAAEAHGNGDCEFLYLRFALEAAPKDVDTNVQCARALAARGQLDQAIACWQRVEQLQPGNERAQRAISELTVQKLASGR